MADEQSIESSLNHAANHKTSQSHVLWIIPVVFLLLFGCIMMIVPLFSQNPGLLTRALLRLYRQALGWGVFLVPLGFGVLGAVMILLGIVEKRLPLRLGQLAEVAVGSMLNVVGGLAILHFFVMFIHPVGLVYVDPSLENDPARDMWEEGIPCPANPSELANQGYVPIYDAALDSFDVAACGAGGGYIGAAVDAAFRYPFGAWEAFFLEVLCVAAGGFLLIRAFVFGIKGKVP
jgi:hypothetical protein